jgi:hypothetical protein
MTRHIAALGLLVALATTDVVAQDELVGTWEAVIEPGIEVSGHITLEADNTVEYIIEAMFGPEFIFGSVGDDVLPDIPFFTEGFAMRLVLLGSWAAEGGVLTLHMEDYELTINDVPVEEFLLALARQFAVLNGEEEGIANEDRAAFEEVFIDAFMIDLNADEFEASLVEDFREDAVNAYAVDGNSLFWFEDGEVAVEFRRLTPSVVSESTWGQVKAELR